MPTLLIERGRLPTPPHNSKGNSSRGKQQQKKPQPSEQQIHPALVTWCKCLAGAQRVAEHQNSWRMSFQAKWEKAALSLREEGDGGAEHDASQVLSAMPRQSAKSSRQEQAIQEGRPMPPAWCGGSLVIQRGVPDRGGQAAALRAEHRLSANTEVLWGLWCRWNLGQLIQTRGHLISHLGSLGHVDHEGKTGIQGPSQCEESDRCAEERAEEPGEEGTKPTNTLRPWSRTGMAAHRQACPAAQVLPGPVGTVMGKSLRRGKPLPLGSNKAPGPLKMGQKGSWVILFSAEEGAW